MHWRSIALQVLPNSYARGVVLHWQAISKSAMIPFPGKTARDRAQRMGRAGPQ